MVSVGLLAILGENSDLHPILGEKLVCAAVSPHLYICIQAQCRLPLRQLHSDFGDFNNGVCRVVKIIVAQSNPDVGLLTQQTCRPSPHALARTNKMPVTTTSIGRGLKPSRPTTNHDASVLRSAMFPVRLELAGQSTSHNHV